MPSLNGTSLLSRRGEEFPCGFVPGFVYLSARGGSHLLGEGEKGIKCKPIQSRIRHHLIGFHILRQRRTNAESQICCNVTHGGQEASERRCSLVHSPTLQALKIGRSLCSLPHFYSKAGEGRDPASVEATRAGEEDIGLLRSRNAANQKNRFYVFGCG